MMVLQGNDPWVAYPSAILALVGVGVWGCGMDMMAILVLGQFGGGLDFAS
jgi:hypothetical protein